VSKRWTPEEENAWKEFFRAGGSMPKGRELHCAIRHLQPDPIADLRKAEVAHKTSTAAMRHLSRVPHKHDGDPIRFIEQVQVIATQPWLEAGLKHKWPEDVFSLAVKEAREAVRG